MAKQIHADEALIIAMPLDASMNDGLKSIYQGLPSATVKACEARRIAIEYGSATNLMQVRDILVPYGRFKGWCEASGFVYPTVMAAIRRLELRMVAEGETETATGRAIKPPRLPNGWAVSWGLRNALGSQQFDLMWDGRFLEWMQRQPRMSKDGISMRDRCLRLAGLLMEAARVDFVEAEIVEGSITSTDDAQVMS